MGFAGGARVGWVSFAALLPALVDHAGAEVRFVDATAAAGLDFVHDSGRAASCGLSR